MILKPNKKTLRHELREIRRMMADTQRRRRDYSMGTTLFSLPEFRRANTVFCYLGLFEKGETDTGPILDRLYSTGKTVCAPYVVAKGDSTDSPARMEARIVDQSTSLVTSDWGLAEPYGTCTVDPPTIDLSIVPCLGVALNGDRIGKGKGFYDRYLENLSAPRICLCYEDCLVDPFRTEEHDERMSVIITERRVVRIV